MTALTMMLLLVLPVAGVAAPVSDLPGEAFAIPAGPVVLRSGPSANHPGVLTLDDKDVVRVASSDGTSGSGYTRVFVPQGFPVYLHGDYVHVDREQQVVTVSGSRLNVRLLPATVGLLPLGQLTDDVQRLQLLDEEEDWVRVLAPVGLALYAPADQLPEAPASVASGRWTEAFGTRELRRAAAVAAHVATDPARLRDRRYEERIAVLRATVLTDLSDTQLSSRETTLSDLAREVGRPDLADAVQRMREAVLSERQRRQAALANLAEQERERAREAANLVREANALDYGLRFLGKGDALTVQGLVSRRVSQDGEATVYSIQEGAAGRLYKLSAAKEIANLETLVGKRVELAGRSLALVNVDGPVLIVDEVVKVAQP